MWLILRLNCGRDVVPHPCARGNGVQLKLSSHMSAGLFAAPAGQLQAGSAQPSGFPAPSSIANFTVGAANHDSRPSSGTGPRRKMSKRRQR